jgi:hypothetical protein
MGFCFGRSQPSSQKGSADVNEVNGEATSRRRGKRCPAPATKHKNFNLCIFTEVFITLLLMMYFAGFEVNLGPIGGAIFLLFAIAFGVILPLVIIKAVYMAIKNKTKN